MTPINYYDFAFTLLAGFLLGFSMMVIIMGGRCG